MAVKLVVIYPRPKDVEAFETVYNRDHVPMAVAKLAGKTKIVATRVLGSPAGESPFHRVAEVYFPSMEALEQCARNRGLGEIFGYVLKDNESMRRLMLARGYVPHREEEDAHVIRFALSLRDQAAAPQVRTAVQSV